MMFSLNKQYTDAGYSSSFIDASHVEHADGTRVHKNVFAGIVTSTKPFTDQNANVPYIIGGSILSVLALIGSISVYLYKKGKKQTKVDILQV